MIKSTDLAATALELPRLNTIPYVPGGTTLKGMDCQGLVKYCAKQNGLTLQYSGSNDMYRNACSGVWTLAEAKKLGRIKPGAVCFMVDHNGGEPDKYKRDGLGDASHVGIVTLDKTAWSVDASASAGRVRTREERNAFAVWTHIGWLKGVAYEGMVTETPQTVVTAPIGGLAKVVAEPTVTFRKEPRIVPGVDNRIPPCPRIPFGEVVETLGAMGEWTKIKYKSWTGWVMSQYLEPEDSLG